MKVDGKPYRTIWPRDDGSVGIIDQTKFPHVFETVVLETLGDAVRAIRDMQVRGAPLIGATAAYGVCLALRGDASDAGLAEAYQALHGARPTAVNLRWALDRVMAASAAASRNRAPARAPTQLAAEICDEDVEINRAIGRHGLPIIEEIARRKSSGAPGQCPHPLQRRLARDRRLGHRDRPDLHGRTTGACPCTCGWTRPGRATRAPR